MNEERLVAWLGRRAGKGRSPGGTGGIGGIGGIGDDTASLPRFGGRTVVTVDQQIEGVHFQEGLDPAVVARRLLAVNLSDLAASGAVPRHAFLALAAPEEFDHPTFFRALLSACRRFGVTLAGGDLATSVFLHLSLTLIGEKSPREAPLGRDQAKPGHRVWLGGTLGESAVGCWLVAMGARFRGAGVELPESLSLQGGVRTAAGSTPNRCATPS
ncbi:MAG: AIR synthase related protein, partial [Candidatus Eisenbacteria bacterium]